MRYLLTIIGFLIFAFSIMGRAEDQQADSSWLQQYYQHPSPGRFETEVRKLQKTGVFSKEDAIYPTAAFFARLFAANTNSLQTWMAVVDSFPEKDRKAFIVALRWADAPATQKLLQKYAAADGEFAKYCGAVISSKPPDFKALTNPAPEELDCCWGSFFATGDKDYVLPVIRRATAVEKQGVIDLSHYAARWSLKSLCTTDPAIKKIKDEFYRTASEQQRKSLDELFAEKTKESTPSKP